jgi:hypothetical protein
MANQVKWEAVAKEVWLSKEGGWRIAKPFHANGKFVVSLWGTELVGWPTLAMAKEAVELWSIIDEKEGAN